jgi:hypothetical protein
MLLEDDQEDVIIVRAERRTAPAIDFSRQGYGKEKPTAV